MRVPKLRLPPIAWKSLGAVYLLSVAVGFGVWTKKRVEALEEALEDAHAENVVLRLMVQEQAADLLVFYRATEPELWGCSRDRFELCCKKEPE